MKCASSYVSFRAIVADAPLESLVLVSDSAERAGPVLRLAVIVVVFAASLDWILSIRCSRAVCTDTKQGLLIVVKVLVLVAMRVSRFSLVVWSRRFLQLGCDSFLGNFVLLLG